MLYIVIMGKRALFSFFFRLLNLERSRAPAFQRSSARAEKEKGKEGKGRLDPNWKTN